MASSTGAQDSKDQNCEWYIYDESDKCGICGSDFQTPKSLKCLHNFCKNCLSEKTNVAENIIICPTCDEKTILPKRGVDRLNTNYMLIQKQERKLLKEQLKDKDVSIPCTYCDDDPDNKVKAIAWCKECQDYLCDLALKYHKIQRKTKLHDVVSLDMLRSGEVPRVGAQKERMCPKHKDEKLRFYCDTCEVPFCRDCGVIEHPRGESHVQDYLEDAVRKRQKDIQKEAEECERVASEVEDTIAQDERVEAAIQKAVEQTLNDYNKAAKLIEAKFAENQQQHEEKFLINLTQFNERRKREIDDHKQKLKNIRSRIASAIAMAEMLTVSGTQYDVADMYKDVISALRELRDFRPLAEHFNNVVFKPNEEWLSSVDSLPAPGRFKFGIWELKQDFGKEGNGQLTAARGITFTPTGQIVVADHSAINIKVFSEQGEYIKVLNPGRFSGPFDVTVVGDGSCYVTDTSQAVKKFNAQIGYLTTFSSAGYLYGIAATHAGGWVTCSYSQNLIYVYNNVNGQMAAIPAMQPWFISVTSKDNFVFTSQNQKSVQMVNASGQLMQIIGPPPNVDGNAWVPYGVCCSPDDEILVANQGHAGGAMGKGIYRFKLSGEFVDCITTDINKPLGLAISDDGEKIAVVDDNGSSVKIFGLR